MKNKTQNQTPKTDKFIRLKYIAYCTGCLPPKEAGVSHRDFVKFAKFFLCQKTHKLMKDPIWKTYTDEEIIVEYFAYLMADDKEFRIKFEQQIKTTESDIDDFFEWTENLDKKDKKEEIASLPDRVSFNPRSDINE